VNSEESMPTMLPIGNVVIKLLNFSQAVFPEELDEIKTFPTPAPA